MENPNFISIPEARNKIMTQMDSRANFCKFVKELQLQFNDKNNPLIQLENQHFSFNEEAFEAFCKIVGLPPVDIIKKLSTDENLRSQVIQFFLSQESDKRLSIDYSKERGEVYSVEEYYRKSLNPLEILDYCILGLPKGKMVESINLNGSFEIRFVTTVSCSPKRRVGDLTHAGVFVSTTYKTIEIGEYAYRLECQNGLIGEVRRTKRRVCGEKEARLVLASVKDAIKTVFEDVKNYFLPAFMDSDEVELKNPAQFVHQWARANRLAHNVETDLLDLVPTLPEDPTYYDTINLLTGYGSDNKDISLLKLGGKMVKEATKHSCSHCHRPLVSS
ncbi:hypothetical protein BVY01_00700 [bacterium I07]|nr:hypothetical protein BVY01_00700 [bacterium I07]